MRVKMRFGESAESNEPSELGKALVGRELATAVGGRRQTAVKLGQRKGV